MQNGAASKPQPQKPSVNGVQEHVKAAAKAPAPNKGGLAKKNSAPNGKKDEAKPSSAKTVTIAEPVKSNGPAPQAAPGGNPWKSKLLHPQCTFIRVNLNTDKIVECGVFFISRLVTEFFTLNHSLYWRS